MIVSEIVSSLPATDAEAQAKLLALTRCTAEDRANYNFYCGQNGERVYMQHLTDWVSRLRLLGDVGECRGSEHRPLTALTDKWRLEVRTREFVQYAGSSVYRYIGDFLVSVTPMPALPHARVADPTVFSYLRQEDRLQLIDWCRCRLVKAELMQDGRDELEMAVLQAVKLKSTQGAFYVYTALVMEIMLAIQSVRQSSAIIELAGNGERIVFSPVPSKKKKGPVA